MHPTMGGQITRNTLYGKERAASRDGIEPLLLMNPVIILIEDDRGEL